MKCHSDNRNECEEENEDDRGMWVENRVEMSCMRLMARWLRGLKNRMKKAKTSN